MSKFLLNLLLQISKVLVNSKIQFLIQKSFSFAFSPADLAAHSDLWPSHPGRPIQPAHRSHLRGKYVFPFGSRLPEPAASPSSL
jgi:hypothetical protein